MNHYCFDCLENIGFPILIVTSVNMTMSNLTDINLCIRTLEEILACKNIHIRDNKNYVLSTDYVIEF